MTVRVGEEPTLGSCHLIQTPDPKLNKLNSNVCGLLFIDGRFWA